MGRGAGGGRGVGERLGAGRSPEAGNSQGLGRTQRLGPKARLPLSPVRRSQGLPRVLGERGCRGMPAPNPALMGWPGVRMARAHEKSEPLGGRAVGS